MDVEPRHAKGNVMVLRCTSCLDDGIVFHGDGETVCGCQAPFEKILCRDILPHDIPVDTGRPVQHRREAGPKIPAIARRPSMRAFITVSVILDALKANRNRARRCRSSKAAAVALGSSNNRPKTITTPKKAGTNLKELGMTITVVSAVAEVEAVKVDALAAKAQVVEMALLPRRIRKAVKRKEIERDLLLDVIEKEMDKKKGLPAALIIMKGRGLNPPEMVMAVAPAPL